MYLWKACFFRLCRYLSFARRQAHSLLVMGFGYNLTHNEAYLTVQTKRNPFDSAPASNIAF